MKRWFLSAFLLLTACTQTPAQHESPAILIAPDAAARAELLQTVRAALNNTPLTLADDALLHDDVLLIERQPRLDPNGLPANGRELGRPERFRLSTDGKRCWLSQEGSERRWLLVSAKCREVGATHGRE